MVKVVGKKQGNLNQLRLDLLARRGKGTREFCLIQETNRYIGHPYCISLFKSLKYMFSFIGKIDVKFEKSQLSFDLAANGTLNPQLVL